MDKFREKFLNLIENEDLEKLTSEIINKDFKEHSFLEKIMGEPEYLEKAIEIVVSKNNPKFSKLLGALMITYLNMQKYIDIDPYNIEVHNYKGEALEFFKKKIEELEENRYERVLFLKELIFEDVKYLKKYLKTFKDIVEKTNLSEDEKILRLYEFLQVVSRTYPSYGLKIIEDLKKKYFDRDEFYYMYGEIAFVLLMFKENPDLNLIKELFNKFYNWLEYKVSLNIPFDLINANYILYSSVYTEILLAEKNIEILLAEKNIEKAKKVIQLIIDILDRVIKYTLDTTEDVEYILIEYFEHLLYVIIKYYSLIYNQDFDNILNRLGKYLKENIFLSSKEIKIYPIFSKLFKFVNEYSFLKEFDLSNVKESYYFGRKDKSLWYAFYGTLMEDEDKNFLNL